MDHTLNVYSHFLLTNIWETRFFVTFVHSLWVEIIKGVQMEWLECVRLSSILKGCERHSGHANENGVMSIRDANTWNVLQEIDAIREWEILPKW